MHTGITFANERGTCSRGSSKLASFSWVKLHIVDLPRHTHIASNDLWCMAGVACACQSCLHVLFVSRTLKQPPSLGYTPLYCIYNAAHGQSQANGPGGTQASRKHTKVRLQARTAWPTGM